jgi:hypothetical protein
MKKILKLLQKKIKSLDEFLDKPPNPEEPSHYSSLREDLKTLREFYREYGSRVHFVTGIFSEKRNMKGKKTIEKSLDVK